MTPIAFSPEWAQALGQAIEASETYRKSGAGWTGPVILSAGDRGVFLDLAEGRCRDARPVEAGDEESARIVLAASPPVWMEIFGGRLDPMQAVFMKKVTLEKGSMGDLFPHTRSAREILDSAIRIGAHPPEDWGDLQAGEADPLP